MHRVYDGWLQFLHPRLMVAVSLSTTSRNCENSVNVSEFSNEKQTISEGFVVNEYVNPSGCFSRFLGRHLWSLLLRQSTVTIEVLLLVSKHRNGVQRRAKAWPPLWPSDFLSEGSAWLRLWRQIWYERVGLWRPEQCRLAAEVSSDIQISSLNDIPKHTVTFWWTLLIIECHIIICNNLSANLRLLPVLPWFISFAGIRALDLLFRIRSSFENVAPLTAACHNVDDQVTVLQHKTLHDGIESSSQADIPFGCPVSCGLGMGTVMKTSGGVTLCHHLCVTTLNIIYICTFSKIIGSEFGSVGNRKSVSVMHCQETLPRNDSKATRLMWREMIGEWDSFVLFIFAMLGSASAVLER